MQPKATVLTILLICFISAFTKAQQVSISGRITDETNNQPLIGATITIVNSSKYAISETDGRYHIPQLPAGTYTLHISYVGYNAKEITGVEVIASQTTTLNITLSLSSSANLQNVIVKTDARRENLSAVLNTRRNAPMVSDVISADMIRKSPDKSTSDVLKRVSGTTVQDNKFVIVRGMNDRYNEALLNGSLLPSSEPDRKTFAFDIFPAEIVDNITVIKSATPDLPGSFAGGLIQVNTKIFLTKILLR